MHYKLFSFIPALCEHLSKYLSQHNGCKLLMFSNTNKAPIRVLLIKQSSLGDLIHCLPAITDATKAIPGIEFDWVVEEAFVDIVKWHPAVKHVIPIALRRWRTDWRAARHKQERIIFRQKLKRVHYDSIIDAQAILKSAITTYLAKGIRCGFSKQSMRSEKLAARFYQKKIPVALGQHAIERNRQLFEGALNYQRKTEGVDYGVDINTVTQNITIQTPRTPYLIAFHGTTWDSKFWPIQYWAELASLAVRSGYNIFLPWGNKEEKKQALEIRQLAYQEYDITNSEYKVQVLDKLSINELTRFTLHAKGAIAVDSGFAHVSAMLGIPLVTIFGSTNPLLTAALASSRFEENVLNLQVNYDCAPCMNHHCKFKKQPNKPFPPCYTTLPPIKVWKNMLKLII